MVQTQDVLLFALLAALLALGWWRERQRARRGATELDPALRLLLLLAALGGSLGAIVWFALLPDTFPWALPPLASRFLSAASAAFAVGSGLALLRGRWPEARLLLAITLGYFIPLLLALPFHLDRFDFARPVTWGFFLVGAAMFVLALLEARRAATRGARAHADSPARLARWARMLIAALGVATLLLGALMLLAPAASLALWPWTWTLGDGRLDALTLRLVAVMFIGLAVGAGLALRDGSAAVGRLYLAMVASYALVAALGVALFVTSRPATPAMFVYLALVGLFGLGALLGLASSGRAAGGRRAAFG